MATTLSLLQRLGVLGKAEEEVLAIEGTLVHRFGFYKGNRHNHTHIKTDCSERVDTPLEIPAEFDGQRIAYIEYARREGFWYRKIYRLAMIRNGVNVSMISDTRSFKKKFRGSHNSDYPPHS